MISDKCMTILDKTRNFPPCYADRLANHLPMVLISLDKIGANKNQLEAFSNHYSKRFLKKDVSSIYLENYNKEIKIVKTSIDNIGLNQTITQYIDRLINGVTASAFHCLIRLAYAVESEIQDEIINALAYWVIEYEPIELSEINSDDSLDFIVSKVEQIRQKNSFKDGIIIDRVLEAYKIDVFNGFRIQPSSISLDAISKLCLDLFYTSNNFTILHTVTACHALRLLQPFFNNQENILRHFFQGIIFAYITTDHEMQIKEEIDTHRLTWDNLLDSIKDSKNDHQIKLMYSLFSEYKHYNDKDYLRVAKKVSENGWIPNFL
ncbi:MAG: questin oxidase family protein [Spirochaetaceae bacterium]